jgi:hypothetical protein
MDLSLVTVAVASVLLALVIAYASWTKISLLRLKADLLEIMVKLQKRGLECGWLDDPAFKAAINIIFFVEKSAEFISMPTIDFITDRIPSSDGSGFGQLTKNSALQNAIKQSINDVSARATNYVLRDTLAGWLYRLKPAASQTNPNRKIAKKEIRENIKKQLKRSLEPLGALNSLCHF